MRRALMMVFASLFFFSTATTAQEASRTDLHVGYSLLRFDAGTNFPFTQPENLNSHGLGTGASFFFSRHFGLGAELGLSGSNATVSFVHPITNLPVTAEMENFATSIMIGPIFRYPADRVTIYGQPAIGLLRLRQEVPTENLQALDNDFAFSIGGGVDVGLAGPVALRFAPAYIRSYLSPGAGQNNWRFTTGLVFKLGRTR